MTEVKPQHHPHSFVWGLIIGGGLMYLLSTPNGRRILKEISEGGFEKFEEYIDVEELAKLKQTLSEEFAGEDMVEKVESAESPVTVISPKRRRLFKGIKRR